MARVTKIEMEWDDGMHHTWSRPEGQEEFDLVLFDPNAPSDVDQHLRVSGYDFENIARVMRRGYEGDPE